MSFYSYKNANAEASPGSVNGNVLTGLNKRVCIQGKERLRFLSLSGTARRQEDRHLQHRARAARRLPRQLRRQLQLLLRGQRVFLHLQRPAAAPSPTNRPWKTPRTAPAPCPLPAAPGRLRAAAPPPPRAASPTCAWSASATGRSSPASRPPWTCPSTCCLPTRDVRNGSVRPCCRWTATCFCASRTIPSSPSRSRAS